MFVNMIMDMSKQSHVWRATIRTSKKYIIVPKKSCGRRDTSFQLRLCVSKQLFSLADGVARREHDGGGVVGAGGGCCRRARLPERSSALPHTLQASAAL